MPGTRTKISGQPKLEPILPGSTLGVLGGGQLGRMFAIAARRLGYRVHVFAPEDDTPTGQVADVEVRADYNDLDAVEAFARRVSVVTFEFENVPAATAETAGRFVPVRPSGHVLHIAQNREREKTFLRDAGLPVTPFRPVRSAAELRKAVGPDGIGSPAVLKSASWGYDGKGQSIVGSPDDAERAWAAVGADVCVAEAFIDFDCEVSVIAVRGMNDAVVTYGPLLNRHRHHILDVTLSPPAYVSPTVAAEAIEIAEATVRALDAVGVVCIEFFLDRSGRLMINEIAPRPHNSGHLTIDAHESDQFEQQVRAVCGLPLGSTRQLRPAAMANLLGDVWLSAPDGLPNWAGALAMPDTKLHLYGKKDARAGRKMGHLTVLAETAEIAAERASAARAALTATAIQKPAAAGTADNPSSV
ncbi:MAG: 5-(carboxyamino)imidazole ribonucleotide synthase [Planctomycetota bacterium]